MRIAHSNAVLGLLATTAGLLGCAPSLALASPAPPSNAEVAVSPACGAPAPGYARCDVEQLVYRLSDEAVQVNPGPAGSPSAKPTATATPATDQPHGPGELQSAYKLASLAASAGSGKTVAIVDAYDDPNAESDLATYRAQYGLGDCTTANGCFQKVEQAGTEPSPESEDWSLEVSLDVDMVSAVCPKCKILLYEAATPSLANLAKAENQAAEVPGVVAISNSYGTEEGFEGSRSWTAQQGAAYSHAGIAITASAGDDGYEMEFPAVLGTVTAVGGTSLRKTGGTWSQAAWAGSGAGCSEFVTKPSWQTALGAADSGCSMRANNDVSADADPETGAIVYDSFNSEGGWNLVGGTSESSPMVAAFYALIGQEAGVGGASWDYAHTGYFTDVVGGSDKSGCASYLCQAIAGFDGPTGLGTPDGTPSTPPGNEGGGSGGSSPPESGGGSGQETGSGSSAGSPGSAAGVQPGPSVIPAVDESPAASSASAGLTLSGLALTRTALISLDRSHPSVSQLAFAFSLSAPTHVRVTLSKRVGSGRHAHWLQLPYSITIAANKGRTSGHLKAHHHLNPGTYELTLAPAHGAARSIVIDIG